MTAFYERNAMNVTAAATPARSTLNAVRRLLVLALLLLGLLPARAVVTVNPNGVNVRASGPTTVFLTFQGLDAGEQAVEAFWCGAVQPGVVGGAVATADPCVPGTLYGRLPLRHDQARVSNSGVFTNLTDIMTIPATVARRAYQDAAAGQASDFFYVRRFSGGPGGDRFVVVTCRMSAAGARTPLALLDVRLQFEGATANAVLPAVARTGQGGELPRFAARILYNGTGELRGRWELVQPGDPEPTEEDLLTEATLPPELRGTQRRWRLVERFQVFALPGGELTLPGPDPKRIALDADGPYKLLLRVEASDDKEGLSNTGGGRLAASGGVAGFALPVLRFYVGGADQVAALAAATAGPRPGARIELLTPGVAALPAAGEALRFAWVDIDGGALYRLEVQGDGVPLLAAFIKPLVSQYLAPAFLAEQPALERRWRVLALDAAGRVLAQSDWRALAGRP